ncbi:HAD family hydrolase [Granulosicoccus sp. 3-233]|uniref:HAD family hydrolase n=1 Tax=Granulosicoccus sp. 3-233 TaxID=3417969 RepID=UPI003D351496
MFDMDGTLTCAMHDFDIMRSELELPAGVPILEALAALTPDTAREKRAALDAMELRMAADARPQPGSHRLLTQLRSQGASLGIVTRNGKEIAQVTLKACGLDDFFDESTIVSRDCCTAKPDPAGLNLLLSRWEANADEAVMVGDYLFDLQAGHSAGVSTVHMDVDGVHPWPELTSLSVSSLLELSRQIM